VDHRAKNALALVQSILRLTRADSMQGYVSAVEGRIAALSHAHTLLSESRWQGADLRKLVFDELAPYEKARSDLISIEGPAITLLPATAQSVALTLHELATNSVKYGSLSSKSGKLAVRWAEEQNTIVIDWDERDGPPVQAPKVKGFGIKVVTATVESQLQGKVNFDWAERGLHCRISIPYIPKRAGVLDAWPLTDVVKPPPKQANGRKPVLLVEDEVLVGMALKEMLDEIGMNAIGPYGGVKEALAAACMNDISAAVLDVSLGGEPVYEVADFLAGRNIPFVFVTGYDRESVDSRFDGVPLLRKPVDHDSLRKILHDYISADSPSVPDQAAALALAK
jgi:two-component sensor histidine kinase/CheY-like chemotaxis protein